MRTLELTANVGPDHKVTLQLPQDIVEGEHRIVLVIDEELRSPAGKPAIQFSPHAVGLVDESFTFRREDMYGDDGR